MEVRKRGLSFGRHEPLQASISPFVITHYSRSGIISFEFELDSFIKLIEELDSVQVVSF